MLEHLHASLPVLLCICGKRGSLGVLQHAASKQGPCAGFCHATCHATWHHLGAWPGSMQHRCCWSGLLVTSCLAICLEAARLCERIRLHAAESHLMSRPVESRWEQTSDGSLPSTQTYLRTKED